MRLRGRPVPKALLKQLTPASTVPPDPGAPVSPRGQDARGPLHLELPLPPSANDYWVIGWHRRKPCLVLSDEARTYKRALALRGKAFRRAPLDGPVELRLRVHFANGRSDLSNRIKVLEDALQGVAYINDRQVCRLVAERAEKASPPYVEVEVLPWAATPDG